MVNTTACIVALPADLDPVRLVGDEEKHATLLFLGETASLPEEAKTSILETLGTASIMFRPFSEEVIDISRLGSDAPPALVSKLTDRFLRQVRDALQINPAIVTYMANGTQYPQFTPHVTLGYPDWAGEAKIKDLAKTLYSVNFDRIALWWNDERFEFKLGEPQEPKELKMKMPLVDFLAHHGIKGMKWGIRRDRSTSAGGAGTKKNVQSDKKAAKAADRAAPGSVAVKKDEHGNVVGAMIKTSDGKWKDTELSADAERFVKTRMKASHEMSDVELRAALNRAQMVKQYDELFSPKAPTELQAAVQRLELEKRYRELNGQLNPPKRSAVHKFIAGTGAAYTSYSKLDKATGGAVSTQLGKKLTGVLDPEAAASAARKASLENQKFEAGVRKVVAEAAKAEAKAKS